MVPARGPRVPRHRTDKTAAGGIRVPRHRPGRGKRK